MNRKNNSKQTFIRSAGAGFFIAFIGTLFSAPMKGSSLRHKVANRISLFINYPTKMVAAYRGRKEKFRELGHVKYEKLQSKMNDIKDEAHSSAEQKHKRPD